MDANTLNKLIKIIKNHGVFDWQFYKTAYGLETQNPDQLLSHYVNQGDAKNLKPNSIFDPAYYRKTNSLKLESLGNSLVDYLLIGNRYGAEPCAGFDTEFVSREYGVEKSAALKLYVSRASEGKYIKPNFYFDPNYYFDQNPDIKAAKIDPYYHFINWGANEGRLPQQGFSWAQLIANLGNFSKNNEAFIALVNLPENCRSIIRRSKSSTKLLSEIKAIHRTDRYEPIRPLPNKESRVPVDVFAFYLTQFHRIPENDAWWGPGFTEWNNVVRGLPRFHGHYQPRVPADLGFYDLTNLDTLRKQVELAKAGGLTGFGFYYYNFGGKRLLERPLNMFLDNKDLDLKFFYIWANETWSKRWDGSENEILIEQKYPDSIIKELVADATQAFQDDRYYRIDGRALYVIYRPSAVPDPKHFVATLRAEFSAQGQNPLIYMAQSFNDLDPTVYDLDGAMEFPPHKYTATIPTYNPKTLYTDSTSLRVYEYDDVVEFARNVKSESYPLVRACFPSWDNDARKQGDSVVINGSTPEKFKEWLDVIIKETRNRPHHPQVICVNAWNEWGEGAYLEPDRHFGHAYLNALQSVVHNQHRYKYGKMLLVGHDAFPSGAQRLLLRIGEALQKFFSTEITFLLLRADKGYDGFLNNYRGVATTVVADPDDQPGLIAKLSALQRDGYKHALVNTAVASRITPLLGNSWTAIQLIHELEGMLAAIDSDGSLKANLLAADKVIAPTSGIHKLLSTKYQIPQSKLRTRPQGLYRNIRPVNHEENQNTWKSAFGEKTLPKIVVGLGYADRRKGADIFVSVCKNLLDSGKDVRFVWQGDWDPALRSELNYIIQDLQDKKRLILLPLSDNVEGLLDIADVFFLSSREDPLPTVAFEAWAFGKPVVAIEGTGGIADLISEVSKLGELATNPPTPQSCAEAISSSLSNEKNEHHQARIDWVKENCGWCDYVFDLRNFLFENPVIDVRIVAHNHADFFEKRVGSLIKQTVPPRSIEYVDIGSSNETKSVLVRNIQSITERVKLRLEESNHGKLYNTWLTLAKESSAEFLHIAEGDDSVDPDFLELLSDSLSNNPDCAFAFSAVRWVDKNGELINESLSRYVTDTLNINEFKEGFFSSSHLLKSGLMATNPILSMSSVLWKRDFLIRSLEALSSEMEQLTFAYDWLLYAKSSSLSKGFCFIASPLTNHTQHSNSMSNGGIRKHLLEIEKCHSLFNKMFSITDVTVLGQKKYLEELNDERF